MEKGLYVFAGVLLGAVVLAALARIYPRQFAAQLLRADDDGTPQITQADLDAARAAGEAAGRENVSRGLGSAFDPIRLRPGSLSLSSPGGLTISPSMLRLLPPGSVVGA